MTDMYLPAMPTLQKEFAVDAARVQHTLSAYLLGLAIGQLGFGPVADRYGRKAPLIGGLLVFTLASAACGMQRSPSSSRQRRAARSRRFSTSSSVAMPVCRPAASGCSWIRRRQNPWKVPIQPSVRSSARGRAPDAMP